MVKGLMSGLFAGMLGGENAHICGKWRENAYFMERIEGMGRTPLFSNKTHMLENIFSKA